MKEFQVWLIPSSGLNRAPPCTAAKERNRSSNGGHRPQAGDEDGADKSRGTRSGRRSRTPPHGVYKSVVRGESRTKTKRSWLVIPPRKEFIKCNNSAKNVIKSSSPIVRVPKSRRIEVGSKKMIPVYAPIRSQLGFFFKERLLCCCNKKWGRRKKRGGSRQKDGRFHLKGISGGKGQNLSI